MNPARSTESNPDVALLLDLLRIPGPSTEEEAHAVHAAAEAMRAMGIEPALDVNDGGMDANWLTPRGLPTVIFGAGQHGAHTVTEWIDVEEFLTVCRLAERLVAE